ncbi:MAG: hypothetical protein LC102_01110 [Ignavibacteriales bacterium]|nr:hypothetical protein [Ignavibacteriales bacterium]
MAKAKISSQDFLDLMDEQNDQPPPAANTFGRVSPPLSSQSPRSNKESQKQEPTINREQTVSNTTAEPLENWQQTGNKVGTQPTTNREQTGNREDQKKAPLTETGNKVGTQPTTLSATKRQQTDNKVATKVPFSSLVGLQRNVVLFIYNACKNARGRSTEALTLEHMGLYLKTSSGSVKTTIQRLEGKGCLARIEFKNGRGGWSKYELHETVFRELLQLETENKLATNWQQTDNKVGTQPTTEPATSLSSSSSDVFFENLKKTTTSEQAQTESISVTLSPEWLAVDYSDLSGIGFTETHLTQIMRQGKLKASEVQDSINFFAFDLARNGKGKALNGPPLNFFMGIVRKGIPYAPPENYESPADEVRRKTREFKELKERKREAEEQQLKDLEFSEWRRGLPSEELTALLPEFARKPGPLQDSTLKSHFETNVWPERSDKLLKLVQLERTNVARQIEQSLGGET